jgi:hypothetical protein
MTQDMKHRRSRYPSYIFMLIASIVLLGCSTPVAAPPLPTSQLMPTSTPRQTYELTPTSTSRPTYEPTPTNIPAGPPVSILVDDFSPQPYQGQSEYFYNRLEGDRGALNESNQVWGVGQVTTELRREWGGAWMSLNHPIREGLAVDFSAVLPAQIAPAFQSQITRMTVHIVKGTPRRTFKMELKIGDYQSWQQEVTLEGGSQVLVFDLPVLRNVNHLVWVLDHAAPGDYVVLDGISLEATTQITDTATAAFVWSYGMLLNNWNPATGMVRDKAKDASGEFDAVQATGSLAAATAMAAQLGVVERSDAIEIVDKISETLLLRLPRLHGLWPHWVRVTPAGEFAIVEGTEWSSVDTVIAAVGLLEAQSGLGMDTLATESMLQEIEWGNLVTPYGISHGYTYQGELIPYAWDAFGGESWLVELACAGATGKVVPLRYPSPPTANGSGFIDELAWLFVPPPSEPDYWGTDWQSYRATAADNQLSYYPAGAPTSCPAQLGLFGLSAAEVPAPAMVAQNEMYRAYGVGGAFAPANDGSLVGAPVVVPHYSAMIASLRPEEAIRLWDWLIANQLFSPLNNVESLMFPADTVCDPASVTWNQLKGSWNLVLQTLGWGRYLAEREGQIPILWQAAQANTLLRDGYSILASRGDIPPSPATPEAWWYQRECEYPDEHTVGQMIERPNAEGFKVHGQFGTEPAWPAKAGWVQFNNISIPQTDSLFLALRYSKYSSPSVPILIYIDDESTPRATLIPIDQGDWDRFTWTGPISLGSVESGYHSIRFSTEGQEYGVADLDRFVLAVSAEGLPTQ